MTEIQVPCRDDGIAKPLWIGQCHPRIQSNRAYRSSCRPYTIEHISSECDCNDDVLGISLSPLLANESRRTAFTYHSHHITGFLLGQLARTSINTTELSQGSSHTGGPTHTWQNSSFASPPDKPPIAMPGVSLATIF